MSDEHFHAVMDRKIFNLDLPVETTSAYILIASLIEQGVRPTLDEIRGRWNKHDTVLDDALVELMSLGIIRPVNTNNGTPYYIANPSTLWRSKPARLS